MTNTFIEKKMQEYKEMYFDIGGREKWLAAALQEAIEKGKNEQQLAWLTPTMAETLLKYNHAKEVEEAKRLIITQYKEELLEKINKLYQDEHPVDCIDGETPVETYGYEATHNNALSEVKKLL